MQGAGMARGTGLIYPSFSSVNYDADMAYAMHLNEQPGYQGAAAYPPPPSFYGHAVQYNAPARAGNRPVCCALCSAVKSVSTKIEKSYQRVKNSEFVNRVQATATSLVARVKQLASACAEKISSIQAETILKTLLKMEMFLGGFIFCEGFFLTTLGAAAANPPIAAIGVAVMGLGVVYAKMASDQLEEMERMAVANAQRTAFARARR